MASTLRLPLEVTATGTLRTHVQGSPAELAQSARAVLSTLIGERAALPDYGLPDQIGALNVDEGEIALALAEWESRLTDPQITRVAQTLESGAGIATVTVII